MLNFTSNSKLFVDFGATLGGSGGGAVLLQAVTSAKETEEGSIEVKPAIGVRGGAGMIEKQGGGTIMLTETRHNPPQVKWRQLKRDKKYFMVMCQDEDNGPRQKWFNVRVSKVERSMSAEGEHTDEIELKYLSTSG